MKIQVSMKKWFIFIFTFILLTCSVPGIGYGQTLTASTPQPLTEATLHESVVTLTLNGGSYEWSDIQIGNAVQVSGVPGVTVGTFGPAWFGVDRVSNTKITVELGFSGNIDADATLTFTVGAAAIANYNGPALTAQVPVSAISESIVASTPSPLTEATLHESVVTLTLSQGVTFERSVFAIRGAVSVSGIKGVTIPWHQPDRSSDTKITVELGFSGNIDADATLTFTVGAAAIANYNGPALTAQVPVSAISESIVASTPSPLTEATLHESVVTLTLSEGTTFERSIFAIRGAVSVSGIKGVTIPWHQPDRSSDTKITVELGFSGNIDADATLTFTVGAKAIANYNGPALTANVFVTASNERVEAPTTQNQEEPVSAPATPTEIQWPWLWMVVPTDPTAGSGISTDIDSLADASGGSITETHVAQNGVNEGDAVGELQWTRSGMPWSKEHHQCRKYNIKRGPTLPGFFSIDVCIDPTVCWANNINSVVGDLGMGAGLNTKGHTAYALINLMSPRDQDATMWVQSGDAIAAWINGRVVYRENAKVQECRKLDISLACDPTVCVPDPTLQESAEREAPIPLKTGNNLLLMKIRQHGEYWDMKVRVYGDFTPAIPTSEMSANVPPTRTQETPTTTTTLSISPSLGQSPAIGEQLTLALNITGGENVAGYQAAVQFDTTALRYISGTNGDYLPTGAFFVPPVVEGNRVKLAATSLSGESSGAGTLATLTFEVIAVKASTLTLSDALFTDRAGETAVPHVENAKITELPASDKLKGDVNGDGTVNIADLVLVASNLGKTGQNAADVNGDGQVNIADLVLVAGALGNAAAAPSLHPDALEMLTSADVRLWLSEVRHLKRTDPSLQRGILFLEQLLTALIPNETALLANYPNPFNPETWIPYQLSKPADVSLTIYDIQGRVVRALDLGHQRAGTYHSRSRAAYWDGRNAVGEPVASGVYFYTLTAGDFSATRKMLIRK